MQKRLYADKKLASNARSMVTHKFTTFKESAETWQKDFEMTF